MKNFSLFFFVISLLVIIGCSQKNKETEKKTYRVFQKGYMFAIAESNADTSTLRYEYTKVEMYKGFYYKDRLIKYWDNADHYPHYPDEYFKVSKGFDGYGLCKNNQLIIPAIYADINCVNNNPYFWRVEDNDGTESLFASNGKLVYHPINNIQIRFREDSICYLDVADSIFAYTGEKLLGPFNWIGAFDSKTETFRFSTCDESKSGIVSKYGEKIIEFPYEDTSYPILGLYRVCKGESEGIVDINGKVIVPLKDWQPKLEVEKDTTITYWDGKEWGFYDSNGIQHNLSKKFPEYSLQNRFISGNAVVKNEGTHLYGLLSKTGKFIVPCEYENFGWWDDDIVFHKNNIRALFDRKTGQIIKYI